MDGCERERRVEVWVGEVQLAPRSCRLYDIIHKGGPLLSTESTVVYITYRLFCVGVCGRERAGQLEKEGDAREMRLALWGCCLHNKQFHSCSKNSRSVLHL